jgi:hypothetical protein
VDILKKPKQIKRSEAEILCTKKKISSKHKTVDAHTKTSSNVNGQNPKTHHPSFFTLNLTPSILHSLHPSTLSLTVEVGV